MSRRLNHIYLLLIMLLFAAGDLSAQVYPGFSQYLINGMVINPAYAGSRGTLSTLFSYRQQWAKVDGAPQFQTASMHAPMKNDKVALGLMYNRQSYGVTRLNNLYGVYAYQLHLGESRLSFGLQGGVDIDNSDYSGVETTTPNDPAFTGSITSSTLPNVGVGVYYYNRSFFAGASVPALLSYKSSSFESLYHSVKEYDFLVLVGGLVTFTEGFRFKPSALVKYSMTKPMEVDINGNFIIADFLWLGASYRMSEQSLIGILEMQVTQQIKIGYSYDYQMGALSNFSNGTHEFLMRLEFGQRVSASSPRYF